MAYGYKMINPEFVSHQRDIEQDVRKPLNIDDTVTVEREGNTHWVSIHYKGGKLTYNALNATQGTASLFEDGRHMVLGAGICYSDTMSQWWLTVRGEDIQYGSYSEMIQDAARFWLS